VTVDNNEFEVIDGCKKTEMTKLQFWDGYTPESSVNPGEGILMRWPAYKTASVYMGK
jgi:hypothetical protein